MSDFTDHMITKVIGLDIEKEDREVGIFGNEFCLILKDDKGHQHQLSFYDDVFVELLDLIKPHVLHMESERKLEEEMEKEYESP